MIVRIAATLIVCLSFGGFALADNALTSEKRHVEQKRPVQAQLVRSSRIIEIAPAEPAPQKRCDNLLCSSYMVLGSGY